MREQRIDPEPTLDTRGLPASRTLGLEGEEHRQAHTRMLLGEAGASEKDLRCEKCGKKISLDDKKHYIVFGWTPPNKPQGDHKPRVVAWCGKHRAESGLSD